MRRLPLVVAGTWLTVLVGLLTNLVTGDSPPWWLWVVWVAVALALTAVELRRQRGTWSLLGGAPEATPRDRARALSRSGEHVAAALREEFASVQPLTLSLRSGDEVSDSLVAAYDVDESLLVLGAAGAGKSTELLRLARVLVRRAERAHRVPQPVPAVLSLAGWGRRRRVSLRRKGPDEPPALLDWLLAQARTRYGLLPDVARAWLRQRQLVLLLDGLDEVRADLRRACVKAIDELAADPAAPPLVVTCRTGEGALPALARTVTVEPLTSDQVERAIGPGFHDLVDTPLWLRVARTAHPTGSGRGLLDAYVAELLGRRGGSAAEQDRLLRGIGLLVRVAERTDDPRTAPTRPGAKATSLPNEVALAVRRWVTPTLVAGILAAGAALPLALSRGLSTGLLSTLLVAGFAWVLGWHRAGAWPTRHAVDPVRSTTRRITGALGGLALGVVIGLAVAVLAAAAAVVPELVLPALAFYTGTVFIVSAALSHRVSLPKLIITTYVVVVVIAAAVGFLLSLAPEGFDVAFVAGGLCAICCRAVVDASAGGVRPGAGRVHRIGRWAPMVASAAGAVAVGLATVVGAPASGPVVAPLVGLLIGLLAGYPLASLTSVLLRGWWWSSVTAWAGMLPWRTRRFLRTAAACGLVTADGRAFRFPHLVLRDHLRAVDLVDGRVRGGPSAESRDQVLERVVRRLGARPADCPRLLDLSRRFRVSASPSQELDSSGTRLVVCGPAAETSSVLLEVAHVLAAKAVADDAEPVPVLLDLATWPGPPIPGVVRPFTAWLLGRLREDYGIDPATGFDWLVDHRLVPVVDGVPPDRLWYFAMVEEFRHAHGYLPMVVAGGAYDGERPEQMISVVPV
ncbi:NACHT domain-containing protein [Actinosynnema sp. NPDC047251]|uniref:NACHT domain-containing protein n=1 Tax=Saccharothrix espanaensis (strain ATCC 51144 / DSM 44229 / JCM 9112 / NBRC 15066 / NRRL 15764) TaxID=1179773 RepID=K0K0A8_SACES|nr:NACHT domain-containing protein [Saccharothrix espanaensis]CCH29983.1 hypothetical protein BN6_26690 [Saccharothrix espanaensis DSM 44229]